MTQHQPIRMPGRRRPSRGRRAVLALAALVSLAAAACGGDADDGGGLSADNGGGATSGGGARTVEVVMTDNEFSPDRVEVAAGETVTLTFANEGAATHDAVVGDAAAQDDHEDEMRAAEGEGDEGMDGMGHGAEAEDHEAAITLEPRETGELTHTFAEGDELLIGCHEPGHYDAGMRIDVAVSGA